MRVLVTGSRNWTDANIIGDALRNETSGIPRTHVTVVHGACPYGGADTIAAALAQWFRMQVEPHPAERDASGKILGPERNQRMVDLGADICLAFPMSDSHGTWDCVRRAKAAGIPVRIFEETTDG